MGKPTANHQIPTGDQEKILDHLNVDGPALFFGIKTLSLPCLVNFEQAYFLLLSFNLITDKKCLKLSQACPPKRVEVADLLPN